MHLYTTQIVEGKIPFALYWDHPDHLDALCLERLVIHALRLERRFRTSETPVVIPLTQKRSITWVHLVRSEWLLVASSDAGTSVVTLWSIPHLLSACDTPVPLAEAFLSAPVKTGCIDPEASTVVFALELRGRIDSIEILSIVDDNGSPRICRLQTLNMAHIRFLKDDFIGVSLVNNLNIPSIVNWRDGSVKNLRPGPDLEGGAIAMHMGEGWVAVVRMTVIEIYVLRDNKYQCWSTQDLSCSAPSAVFHVSESSLRVCITCDDGIFIFEMCNDLESRAISLHQIWHHQPELEKLEFTSLATQGRLSPSGYNIC
ncbi:hypothetical protein QCA50_016891 [Cerrena zonata]|uniref:Uncharacterized protein n=1 Tax=Cerrena zonata TaxID=2478898 RepID=A0AAW0FTD6_9APHY